MSAIQESGERLNLYAHFVENVQEYMDHHLYAGHSESFQFAGLRFDEVAAQTRPLANVRLVEINGLGEESLSGIDEKWLGGLFELGRNYGLELRLPYEYFEK